MANLRDIRQKIKGIATTQQITGAMKMMSTARLGRAMESINLRQDYINKMEQMVQNLQQELPEYSHPCLESRPVKTSCFVIIGGERGLCGGFNHELNRFALKTVQECQSQQRHLIVIGKKAIRFFEHKEIPLYASYPDLNMKNLSTELWEMSTDILKLFTSGEVDEVRVIYTSFASAIRKYLTVSQLLPVETVNILSQNPTKTRATFDFYPSPAAILNQLIPRYISNLMQRAIIESTASEQSARMTAMTSATDRAEEIIDDLKLDLNRSRQALITRELSEVIAGSQA